MNDPNLTDATLLDSRISLPQHVVHRNFVEETVVLNLRTGKYHGLNRTAGQLLSAMDGGLTPRAAAAQVAAEYDVAVAEVEADVLTLCRGLVERELVEVGVDAQPSG